MSIDPANVGRTPTSATGDHWKNHYIYKIPPYKKAQNPGAYSPQLVSIGPYHNEELHLQDMEEHKARALDRFLDRSSVRLKECCEALASSVEKLMNSYQSLGEDWKRAEKINKFVIIMVKDGVFLYEFMRGYPDGKGWDHDYDKQDPVFSVRALRNIPNIVPDILMLENQLPITVLERLIAVENAGEKRRSTGERNIYDQELNTLHHQEVNKLVLKFLTAEQPSTDMTQPLGLHVLDISRKVITRKFEQIAANKLYKTDIGVKPAINLDDVGVKFRVSKIHENRVVSFENTTLSLQTLTFDTTTESRFLNAIAFESLHPATNHEVSSYVAFLQGLMASPGDVRFLLHKNLIQSKVGDEQAVDGLMKSISKDVLFDPSSDLCEVRDCLNKYYTDNMGQWRRRSREWGRTLHQTYFKNPWTIIAFLGATAILIFTALQTIYTMKGGK